MSLERVLAGDFPDDYLPPARCPVCGEECDTYYWWDMDIIGCENCVTARPA